MRPSCAKVRNILSFDYLFVWVGVRVLSFDIFVIEFLFISKGFWLLEFCRFSCVETGKKVSFVVMLDEYRLRRVAVWICGEIGLPRKAVRVLLINSV